MGFFEIVNKIWEALGSVAPNQWGSTILLLCLGTLVVTFLSFLLPPFIAFLKLVAMFSEDLVKTIGQVLVAAFVIGIIYFVFQAWRNPAAVIPPKAITKPVSVENTPDNTTPENIEPVPPPQGQPVSGGICWTYQLQNFSGTRWNAWEMIVKEKVGNIIEWSQFKEDVIAYNPVLLVDEYEFFDDKTYLLPERCP